MLLGPRENIRKVGRQRIGIGLNNLLGELGNLVHFHVHVKVATGKKGLGGTLRYAAFFGTSNLKGQVGNGGQ